MADDEKTEEPTSKKIEDARKEGNVPKSQDLSGFITLLVALVLVFVMIPFIGKQLIFLYHYYQGLIGLEFTKELVYQIVITSILRTLMMVLPITISVAIAGIIGNVMQFGFIFTTKPLEFNLNKINPLSGLKKLFSVKKLIESAKIILKVSLVFIIAFYFLLSFVKELPRTLLFTMFSQLLWLREKIMILAAVMLMLFLVISLLDILLVRFQYFKSLRMSKQEIKDEYKQMEGDPQIKSKIRSLQRQMAQRRMMQNIPVADVVITNPTHYAVALRYDKTKENAPIVLAKGVDHLALKIRAIATEHQIPIIENPPLARELYKVCDIEDEIPANLYRAVAEVLSFVYTSNKAKFKNRL
ncbi:flagellar biosynthesis protein FlhB [Campylobacter sp. RM12327]|uniref:flagellar biosynthesis protein FlhB n=1 Tax=Campylobacter sputorum TaxID=206 RepID=UPI000B77DC5F|nr:MULTISPECIES: flagellar biosynthesis protein FlhB [Campylobacter]ASM39555.1 flagellar export apparatus, flagellar biosynthetic protein FlhB [Campylobacter sputorum]MBE7358808.1 flagellar biosynthesis protein FlhB [Campylobacter sp. RM11302]MBF6669806.1 flagellar biosynthesis protein FlhB [Campylobacter sp. RM12327]MBF6675008.1 flagellar biosynthesis protein FlhB [Campylobacter sp. RM13538]MBF6676558.1 flagellar biosynthesis protein FlhB [Campylobacter sp. RM12321]